VKLALYKGRRSENPKAKLFDRAVAWWTRGPYSHCEIVFEDTPPQVAFCYSSSNRDGGVRCKAIDLTTGHWDVLDLDGFDEDRAWGWFIEHHGAGYDFAGLFGFVLPWRTHDPRRWFCSEGCAAALGLPEPHNLSPNGLADLIRRTP
jgi:hypothetical protein